MSVLINDVNSQRAGFSVMCDRLADRPCDGLRLIVERDTRSL